MRQKLHENGLALTTLALFLTFLAAQSAAGWHVHNKNRESQGQKALNYGAYLTSGHNVEAIFENWESEFLQMAAYVLLSVWLYQKGSPESKKLDQEEPVDANPRDADPSDPNVPDPVRRGGLVLKLYESSLSLALFALFFASFAFHAAGGAREYSREQVLRGEPPVSLAQFLGTSMSRCCARKSFCG